MVNPIVQTPPMWNDTWATDEIKVCLSMVEVLGILLPEKYLNTADVSAFICGSRA